MSKNYFSLHVFYKNKDKTIWPVRKTRGNKLPKGWKFGQSDWVFKWINKAGYDSEAVWNGTRENKKDMIKYLKIYYEKYYQEGYLEDNIIILEEYPKNKQAFIKGKMIKLK